MEKRGKQDKTYVFARMPIGMAVAYLVVPTVITQLIAILYNLADTFFIGQLGDPDLVAAVGICLPPMMFMTAFANLFGVGTTSAISRALGKGDEERAQLCSSFSFWCGIVVALFYILLTTVFRTQFVDCIGGDAKTSGYVSSYLDWTMTAGGMFFFLGSLLAHFTRALGKSVAASVGVASGSILNIVLDPVLLFVFGWGIEGVAIASMSGQALSVAILAIYLVKIHGNGIIRPVPTSRALDFGERGVSREILQIGLVSFCMTALAQVSNMVVNILVSPYGTSYLAASTVAVKLNIATFSISQGLTVGVLPLIGYNYSAGNAERVKGTLKVMIGFVLAVGSACMALTLVFADQILMFFIDDPLTIANGRTYVKSVAFCMVPAGLVFATTSYLQAIGQKKRPYVLAFTRMGTVDVVFMLICNATLGAPWVLLGKPLADWLCCVTALFVLRNLRKHVNPFSGRVPSE